MKSIGDFLKEEKAGITQLICGCFLAQMLIVQPLWWSTDRAFPFLSLFSDNILNSSFSSLILPTLFALCLLANIIFPKKRQLNLVTFFIGVLLLLFDLNRLQTWTYQWLLMLFILNLTTTWENQKKMLQFLIIAVYFWSGFNKLNVYYLDHTFPWLMEAFLFTERFGKNAFLAISSAVLEIAIAVGFCFHKTRRGALLLSISLHLIILLLLGPFGHNWNQVVWPWNIAMIFLVLILFGIKPFPGIRKFFKQIWMPRLLFLLIGLCPALNIIGYWSEPLSFKMYSGTNREGILFSSAKDSICFPEGLNFHYTRNSNGHMEKRLILDDWSLNELKVPPFVSEWSLKQMTKKYCDCQKDKKTSGLEILQVHRWSREERPLLHYNCEEIEY